MMIVFEDSFEVTSIDSSRFDKVSRVKLQALTLLNCSTEIDFNTEIFPISNKQTFSIALALVDDKKMNFDGFDYVMFGKVYKITNKPEIFISYGGLLQSITGDKNDFEGIHVDNNIYLLVKKI